MKDDKFDEALEKHYKKHEFITLIMLTIIILIAWLLHRKAMTGLLGGPIKNIITHVNSAVIFIVSMVIITMRSVGHHLVSLIMKIITKDE